MRLLTFRENSASAFCQIQGGAQYGLVWRALRSLANAISYLFLRFVETPVLGPYSVSYIWCLLSIILPVFIHCPFPGNRISISVCPLWSCDVPLIYLLIPDAVHSGHFQRETHYFSICYCRICFLAQTFLLGVWHCCSAKVCVIAAAAAAATICRLRLAAAFHCNSRDRLPPWDWHWSDSKGSHLSQSFLICDFWCSLDIYFNVYIHIVLNC